MFKQVQLIEEKEKEKGWDMHFTKLVSRIAAVLLVLRVNKYVIF